jgi:hypothetical protein
MTERTLPGLGLRAFYAPGQRDWGTSVSEDLRRLSALVQPRAISRTTALPVSGEAGDIYIVPGGAADQANAMALWDGAAGAEALSAPMAIGQARPKVVVIGGGSGGATAARYIARDSQGAIDVTLIEPSRSYYICHFSNLYLGGF